MKYQFHCMFIWHCTHNNLPDSLQQCYCVYTDARNRPVGLISLVFHVKKQTDLLKICFNPPPWFVFIFLLMIHSLQETWSHRHLTTKMGRGCKHPLHTHQLKMSLFLVRQYLILEKWAIIQALTQSSVQMKFATVWPGRVYVSCAIFQKTNKNIRSRCGDNKRETKISHRHDKIVKYLQFIF